jgi:hypothetical protein
MIGANDVLKHKYPPENPRGNVHTSHHVSEERLEKVGGDARMGRKVPGMSPRATLHIFAKGKGVVDSLVPRQQVEVRHEGQFERQQPLHMPLALRGHK